MQKVRFFALVVVLFVALLSPTWCLAGGDQDVSPLSVVPTVVEQYGFKGYQAFASFHQENEGIFTSAAVFFGQQVKKGNSEVTSPQVFVSLFQYNLNTGQILVAAYGSAPARLGEDVQFQKGSQNALGSAEVHISIQLENQLKNRDGQSLPPVNVSINLKFEGTGSPSRFSDRSTFRSVDGFVHASYRGNVRDAKVTGHIIETSTRNEYVTDDYEAQLSNVTASSLIVGRH